MKHATVGAVGLLALWTVLVPASARAQDPISPGEPGWGTATGTLTGEVISPDGEALPGVEVDLRSGGDIRRTVTDAQGRFRFLGLAPGEYELTATFQGFAAAAQEVDVGVGRQTSVSLILGGPISPAEPGRGGGGAGGGGTTPEGPPEVSEPAPPARRAGPVVVLERRYDDDLALQAALNAENADGRELQAVVSVGPGTSLFVYRRRADPAPCTVIVDAGVEGLPRPDRLEARIGQQANKTFVGVHLLGSGAPALVFRDDR